MENKPENIEEEDPFARQPNLNKKHFFYFILVLLVEVIVYFLIRTNVLMLDIGWKNRYYASMLFYVLIAQIVLLLLTLEVPGEKNQKNLLKALIFLSIVFNFIFLFRSVSHVFLY